MSQAAGLLHKGKDADGQVEYQDPEQLWQKAKGQDGTHKDWYKGAVQYWDQQEASYDGVLGGFGHVSDYDISDSKALLQRAMKQQLQQAAAGQRQLTVVDCGAGVGRVSEQLLLHTFNTVDLLEPSKHLLDTAQQKLNAAAARGTFPHGHQLGQCLCQGLQEFAPQPQRYDCIWIQWCLLYLTDADAISLFQRCKAGLKEDGIIMVKENVCKEGFVVDKDDNSLTRSNAYMLELFNKAEMSVQFNIKQKNFPKELFEVRMYVLKAKQQQQQ